MGISRSTFYDEPVLAADDTAIVEAMVMICDVFEHYGWRRVRAALRQQGMVVITWRNWFPGEEDLE